MARPNKFAEMVKIARENEGEEESVAVRDRGRPAANAATQITSRRRSFCARIRRRRRQQSCLTVKRIYRVYWSGFCHSGSTTMQKCENVKM